jgi:hypothetical protein
MPLRQNRLKTTDFNATFQRAKKIFLAEPSQTLRAAHSIARRNAERPGPPPNSGRYRKRNLQDSLKELLHVIDWITIDK